jgi:uncharacterized protein YxeA
MKKSILYTLVLTLVIGLCSFDNVKIAADKANSYIKYTLSHPLHESIGTSKDLDSATRSGTFPTFNAVINECIITLPYFL